MATISVIVPVYNTQKYLNRCISSILSQSFKDFELIIIDDGSNDNSGDICDSLQKTDSRIVVFHQQNMGQAVARNVGIDWAFLNSESKWIAFIDSDDYIHPDYLQKLYSAVINDGTKMSICCTDEYNINKTNNGLSTILSAEDAFIIPQTSPNAVLTKLYSKSLFENIRFPQGKICEDRAITYQLVFQCDQVSFVGEALYFYTLNPNSTMHSTWTLKRLDDLDAIHNQLGFFGKHNYKKAEKFILKQYVEIMAYSLKMIRRNYGRNIKEYAMIKKELKNAICKYKNILGLSLKSNTTIYREVYPISVSIYLFFTKIKGFIKRYVKK